MQTLRIRLLSLSLIALGAVAVFAVARTVFMMDQLGWPPWIRPWCTVAASAAVFTGAVAALRNRTWGLLLVLLATVSFGGAWVLGIGPAWFGVVTALGLAALGLAAAPLARRDPLAFAVAVLLCLALGAGAAGLAGPGLDLARALR